MPAYRVTKRIEFCYGHRLMHYVGKCQHLHGHNGVLEIDIEADTLDHRGMVVDFTDIRLILRRWVDEHLDHRMLLHREDPLIPLLREQGEPIVAMEENPTAEHIARVVYEQGRAEGLLVAEVRLWETPSSCARYRPAE